MRAEDAALRIHDGPRGLRRLQMLAQEAILVAVAHEADVLAVRLLRRAQAQVPRDRADLGLGQLPQRKQRPGQLRLGQVEEDVRLVLRGIRGAAQHRAAAGGVMRHAGVMAGGDRLRPAGL
ncbi:MAG: Uncharacterized protein FD125_3105, partial [bacterium]